MRAHRSHLVRMFRVIGLLLLIVGAVRAERGYLVLYVADTLEQPISNITVTVKGDGGTSRVMVGKARIRLAAQTRAGDWVTLAILNGKDWVFISPWDERVQVPAFENESLNYAQIVLAKKADRRMLEQPVAARSLAQRCVLAEGSQSQAQYIPVDDRRKRALDQVAKDVGLAPDQIDEAIRAWGQRAVDPYDKGIADLYARNFGTATSELKASVELRRENLAKDEAELADADVALGMAMYNQAKFRDAIPSFQEAERHRPNDPAILNQLGICFDRIGSYSDAYQTYRRALGIYRSLFGVSSPSFAMVLDNLALVMLDTGDLIRGERLAREALAIRQATLSKNHPDIACALLDLALFLNARGRFPEAEAHSRRALEINARSMGSDSQAVAYSKNSLALVLRNEGHYSDAEGLLRQALAIDQKYLGNDHTEVAAILDNLGGVLQLEGQMGAAEPLHKQALTIYENALGLDNMDVVQVLEHLGHIRESKEECGEAESLYRRAFSISSRVLGASSVPAKFDALLVERVVAKKNTHN